MCRIWRVHIVPRYALWAELSDTGCDADFQGILDETQSQVVPWKWTWIWGEYKPDLKLQSPFLLCTITLP